MSEVAGAVICSRSIGAMGQGTPKDTPAEVGRQFNQDPAVTAFRGSGIAGCGGRSLRAVCSRAGALEKGAKGVASGIS